MKKTKFALFQSIVALILCLSMFVSTTFALFTDSITSHNNIITTGKLDVSMYWADEYRLNTAAGGTAATDITEWKDASAGTVFNYEYWEPGFTDTKYIKISNEGNLALTYRLYIVPDAPAAEGEADLADVIDVYILPAEEAMNLSREQIAALTPAGSLSALMTSSTGATRGVLLPVKGAEDVALSEKDQQIAVVGEDAYCIILKMRETTGNEYQNQSAANGFSVQLVATQYTWENDSFGNGYDVEAASMLSSSNDGDITNPAEPFDIVVGNLLKVTVPANALQNPGKVEVKISETDVPNDFVVQADKLATAYEISIEGAPNDGSVIYSVELFAGKNLDTVDVYHKGILIPDTHYDPVTGIVSFKTGSFSPFVVVYDKPVYTVSWDTDGDGNVDDTTEVAFGVVPTHAPGSKPSTAEQSYTFVYWTPQPQPVTGDITYTATFSEDARTYTIVWKDGDKIVDEQQLSYNAIPVYQGETLTKQCHTLSWSSEIVPVTGDATYTAVWTAEHAWSDATCTAPKTCSVCGTEVGAAAGHTEEVVTGKPATCTETGLTEGKKCSICGVTTVEQTVIPANGHSEETVTGKPATCTETGLTEGKKCSICGVTTVEQTVIPANGHSEETVTGKPATCTETGLTEGKKCSICGVTTVEQTVIPANGHTEETIAGKPATCTETGLTEGKKCSICGVTTDEQTVIPANGHTDEDKNYICDVCKDDLCTDHVEETIPGKTATCTESGLTDGKKCSICGRITVAQQTINANGHTEETVKGTAATCTEDGKTDGKKCSVCDAVIEAQQTITAKGHTEEIVKGFAATCTEDGLTDGKKCTVCGETTVAQQTINAKGHTEETIAGKPATCTEDGLTEGKKCTVCGETTVSQQTINANGHTEETVKGTAATCTEDGKTDGKKCSVCGVTTVAQQTITANGHTEEIIPEKAATCITGLTEGKKCSACGETIVAQEIIPAIEPHTDKNGDNRCDVCDGVVYNITFYVGNSTKHVDTLSFGDEINYHEDEMKKYDGWIGWSDTENGNVVEALPETMPAENLTFYAVFKTQELTDKFDTVLPAAKFTYRVGNQNTVALSSLFKAIDGAEIGNDVDVTVAAEKVSVTGTYTKNDTDWAKGTIKFEGTGFVNVTIQEEEISNPYTLKLEVVDAVNATSATSAKANNVVLLQDVVLSTIEVSGGHTLYGNGFKMTATTDPMYDTMQAGFVTLNNGTLDNVEVICPNFSYAIIYNSQIKDNANTSKPSDISSNDARGNVRSAVMVTGNSKIVNSKVHGGRAAIFLRSGNLVINGSTISGGAAANIHALAAQSLTLRNVTLVQKPYTDNVHGTGKTIMGFSGLFECGEDGNSTPLILEGTLKQDAWINESYSKYAPSAASSIVKSALGKTEYLHDRDGDGNNESLNLGFTYIPQENKSATNANVTDNRTNRDAVPYEAVDVGNAFAGAKVYSYKNTNGTSADFTVDEDQYVSGGQGAAAPDVTFTDANADRVFETKFDSIDGRWESTLAVNLDRGNYTFSFGKLLVQKHGENLSYTVKTAAGTAVDTSKGIALTSTGATEYVLTVTDGEATHTIYFILTASKTSIPDPVVADTTGGTPLLVVKSKDSDWTCALPALEGMKVKYYTVDGEVILDLATLTPTSKGKQNGTNNYWEISKDGYKLKVTCGVIHDTKSVYGMPVVVDNNGTMQLYFTISSTNGYVSTNTAARSVTLTYEFTDPNGKTLTFTKTWNFQYADYKNGKQYSYSDFVNGTLKEASGGSSCVTSDTLVTLADGTQKRVDEVTYADKLLVWDFFKGDYAAVPSAIIFDHGYDNNTVIKLNFSDGTTVKVVNLHQFFDADLNEFVTVDAETVEQYVGHKFTKQNGKTVKLVDYSVSQEYVEAYGIISAVHYNIFVEGMLSTDFMREDYDLFNYFEIGKNMKFDAKAMKEDIAEYGLYSYADFADYLTEEQFAAFNVQYFKISVGKGEYTYEGILALIDEYLNK